MAGIDVAEDPGEVRKRLGLALQTAALDAFSTGRETLELAGRMHRLPAAEVKRRSDELLELMSLTKVAGKLTGTYSGGMKRRLDLASALMHQPPLLILDEPTEGLDPQSRTALWEELQRISTAGTTMLLTTHYMEEADHLCDQLAIIDNGKIVVEGTPTDLKRSIGADRVILELPETERERSVETVRARLDGLLPAEAVSAHPSGHQPVGAQCQCRHPRHPPPARHGRRRHRRPAHEPAQPQRRLHQVHRSGHPRGRGRQLHAHGLVLGPSMSALVFETWHLGRRTTMRFLRVPANSIGTIFFPLIQLLLFSQLFQQIIVLPGFEDQSSYLAYLAPGQVVFAAFLSVAWSGFGLLVEYRTGYMDKLRALPIGRWSILVAEMVPVFFQAAAMAGIILVVSVLLGATHRHGHPGLPAHPRCCPATSD